MKNFYSDEGFRIIDEIFLFWKYEIGELEEFCFFESFDKEEVYYEEVKIFVFCCSFILDM